MSENRSIPRITADELDALEIVAEHYDWPELHALVRRLKDEAYQVEFEELLWDEFPDLEPLFNPEPTGK